jgi:phage FluMu protein Com
LFTIKSEMESTVSLFPGTSELRSSVRFPLAIAFYPTQTNVCEFLPFTEEELLRCRNCGSFLSPRSPIEELKWKCVFCGCVNGAIENSVFSTQSNKSSIEILRNSKREIGLIHIFYFSCGFNELDFVKAKVFVFSLLRSLSEDSKCLIFLGSDESGISLLAPGENGTASIARFSSLRGLIGRDLSAFFFTKATAFEAERLISTVDRCEEGNSHSKAIELGLGLSQFTENVPVRFICILPEISGRRVDLEPVRQCLIRLDVVVGDFSSRALSLGSEIPGSLVFLSRHNPALQAKHLLNQTTRFQAIFRYRSSGCSCKVIQPVRPFTDTNSDCMFIPVIPTEQYPIVVEVSPADRTTVLTFQFVTKFVVVEGTERRFLLRISTFSLPTTSNEAEYIESVNWNCVLWFWCRRVCDRNGFGSISAIMRACGLLLKALGDRFEEPVLRAVCALPLSQLFRGEEGHRDRAVDLISFSGPRHLRMIPELTETPHGRRICESVDGIAEERNDREFGPSREARNRQMYLPVYVPVSGTIPPDYITVSPTALSHLQALANG